MRTTHDWHKNEVNDDVLCLANDQSRFHFSFVIIEQNESIRVIFWRKQMHQDSESRLLGIKMSHDSGLPIDQGGEQLKELETFEK